MKYDRFEMEQLILSCWNVTDDIYLVYEQVMDGNPTTDQLANMLLGLHELYNVKFNKLFEMFESSIEKPNLNDLLKNFDPEKHKRDLVFETQGGLDKDFDLNKF